MQVHTGILEGSGNMLAAPGSSIISSAYPM